MQKCEICGKETDNYSTCDSCELIYCIEHLGDHNECPVCGGEHTFKENFQEVPVKFGTQSKKN